MGHLFLLEAKMGWGLQSPKTLMPKLGLEPASLEEVQVIEKTLTLGCPRPVPQQAKARPHGANEVPYAPDSQLSLEGPWQDGDLPRC